MSKEYSKSHYDARMELTPRDIKNGYVRLDTYTVYKANKLGEVDCCGVLFHNLKTIMRYSRKNPIQREVLALVNQTLRLAREEGVDIREALREELDILDEIYDNPDIPREYTKEQSQENKNIINYEKPTYPNIIDCTVSNENSFEVEIPIEYEKHQPDYDLEIPED